MRRLTSLILFLIFFCFVSAENNQNQCSSESFSNCSTLTKTKSSLFAYRDDILVYTVATEKTDGFERYMQSAKEFGIEPNVLGMGQDWKGGQDIKKAPGGGWKINLLKDALETLKFKDEDQKIILFTDGYDVMFLNTLEKLHKAFLEFDSGILFGAEGYCWPDKSLSEKYPNVTSGKRYLNSGGFIGYYKDLKELLNYRPILDDEDDQLFYTQAYLDEKSRNKLRMKLDHNSKIFQNLNGAYFDVELSPQDSKESEIIYLTNTYEHTQPIIVHGNGPSKISLNALGNYLAKAWSDSDGCRHCKVDQLDLENEENSKLPTVLMALFIEIPTPFLEEQLEKLQELKYPKDKIHLFVHNNIKFHKPVVDAFIEKYGQEYASVKQILPEDGTSEYNARDLSLDEMIKKNCDFYFSVDSIAHLDNAHTLRLMIEQNRSVVAPMLVRHSGFWSNFWGALTSEGFYARSHDYLEIVKNNRRGLWNVPYISNCYLVKAKVIKKYDRTKLNFVRSDYDPDMAFAANLRDLDVFMYVSNRLDFGHLVNPETYETTFTSPDMYQIFENEKDWEARYIHPDYAENLNPAKKPSQPCPDVYWFPIVSKKFTTDLINMMEAFGKWSDGKNEDTRLEGGYEAVPTRDIHMNQVGWERHWLYFLKQYVRPLQEHVFTGYFHDPPRSLMNFVVRYRPDEQPFLRPHHDSSTYTINIALNEREVDYEGGGCRFIRYNCSVVDTRPGWMMMHPGRLTHYHEGLLVTKGTRYIMIAFVDP